MKHVQFAHSHISALIYSCDVITPIALSYCLLTFTVEKHTIGLYYIKRVK